MSRRDAHATDGLHPEGAEPPDPAAGASFRGAGGDDEVEWCEAQVEGAPAADAEAREGAERGVPARSEGVTPAVRPSSAEDVEDARPGEPRGAGVVSEDAGERETSNVGARPGVSADAERAALLAAVLRDQAHRSMAWLPRPRRRTAPATRFGAGILLIFAAYAWLTPPAWLLPEPPPPVPANMQEAGLRLGMYLQAQQIEAFRRRQGRLPDVLPETGESLPGMHYRRLDARVYRLRGVTPRMALTYLSTDSLAAFLADAPAVVGFAPPR